MNSKQSLSNTIKTSKYILKMIWKIDKSYILFRLMISFLNSITPLLYAIIPGLIINELTGEQRINMLIIFILVLAVAPVFSFFQNAFEETYLTKKNMEILLELETTFYNHLIELDYETLEKPDIQILKSRTQSTLFSSMGIIDQLCAFLSALISTGAILSIILTLNPLIIFLTLLVICINSIATKWVNKKRYELGKEISITEANKNLATTMLHHFSFAKEIRLYNLKDYLINIFIFRRKEEIKIHLKINKYFIKASSIHTIANLIQHLILYAYLIYSVLFRNLAIGSMTIFISIVNQLSNSLRSIVNSYLQAAKVSLNINELMDFMNIPLKQQTSGSIKPIFCSNSIIEFVNVSFKYPGSERFVLKNINIKIYGNEKLCIVGKNGSGKSTFIKLLLRLYWPTEGEILLNGININKYDYFEYQKLFAPVFQDFVLFYLSFGSNIVLSQEQNNELLENACKSSGLLELVNKLPKKYETTIFKVVDEEGIIPSGGEGQRIAIARACYHGGEIFLLDEPTAALDPLSEYEIYTQFNEMITDKCAILITHRLSAVQLADKVAVFEDGGLVEYGTHKELYKNGGIYTEMFSKQAHFYQNVENIKSQKPDSNQDSLDEGLEKYENAIEENTKTKSSKKYDKK